MTPDHAEEAPAETIDNVVPTRGYRLAPVVGLGGSAGAIGAGFDAHMTKPVDLRKVSALVDELLTRRRA